MARKNNLFIFKEKSKVKRKDTHAKSKQSRNKHSKNYKKKYNGQGR
tara:strand:- start:601 stop:738 length:138 start_codon:yes stop_codon:yes gene_type:complete